jgi:uncharacterized protein YbjT (DUF2867 family)
MNPAIPSKVLVVGGTGTVGGATLRALLARGVSVRALVRSEQSANTLPRSERLETVRVDLEDGASLRRVLTGVQAAFYVSPHEPNEEEIAETFIGSCEEQGIRVVFVGVHISGANRLARAVHRWLYGRLLPHYRPKFRIAERARVSGANPVVLMPTNYFQNDELFRPELLGGTYLQPFEHAMNRVDVRDIADAAVRACTDLSLPSGAYYVVGPESLDAATCAEIWSRALGTSVRYPGVDPARISAALARTLTGKKLADFRASYEVLSKFGSKTEPAELAETRALLGRDPIAYTRYVKDTMEEWGTTELAAQ